MTHRLYTLSFIVLSAYCLSACYGMRSSNGGGQVKKASIREANAQDIAVHPGYGIELVVSGLTFPTAVCFDSQGTMYVLEAGYSYGEVWTEARLLRVEGNNTQVIARGPKNGPWTGVEWHDGFFYVAEGGEMEGGRILKISREGTITTLVSDLPSMGDHHTNGPAIKDGFIYFGQGTATNSGIVGNDNAKFGWLLRRKNFHDIPCRDVILAGQNYTTSNVLNKEGGTVSTGAYMPYGTVTDSGQVVKGAIPCSGSIMRIPISGGNPELVAWGFRNPFGLAFSPEGKLFITENGFDDRGSRPVWGTADVLWEVQQDTWYGWPDFSAGNRISSNEEFKVPGKKPVKSVLLKAPGTPPKPTVQFGVHSSSNGLDFSTSETFGFKGDAFVAQFGDMAPSVGKVLSPVGFKVVRVNTKEKFVRDFATNKGKRNGPATWIGSGGLERPVSVKFNPSGDALYIVDFGVVLMTEGGPKSHMKTGMIWKITKR